MRNINYNTKMTSKTMFPYTTLPSEHYLDKAHTLQSKAINYQLLLSKFIAMAEVDIDEDNTSLSNSSVIDDSIVLYSSGYEASNDIQQIIEAMQ